MSITRAFRWSCSRMALFPTQVSNLKQNKDYFLSWPLSSSTGATLLQLSVSYFVEFIQSEVQDRKIQDQEYKCSAFFTTHLGFHSFLNLQNFVSLNKILQECLNYNLYYTAGDVMLRTKSSCQTANFKNRRREKTRINSGIIIQLQNKQR